MPTSSSPASSSSLKTRSCSFGSRRYETGLASAFVIGKNRSARAAVSGEPFSEPASSPHASLANWPIAWATTSSLMVPGISITLSVSRAVAGAISIATVEFTKRIPIRVDLGPSAGGVTAHGDAPGLAARDNPHRGGRYSAGIQGGLEGRGTLLRDRHPPGAGGLGVSQRQPLPLRLVAPVDVSLQELEVSS